MAKASIWQRIKRAFKRAYEGASPRDGWRPRRAGASANTDHRADARPLRDRARALYQNVPYVTRGVDGLVAARVGSGVKIYSKAASKRTKKRYEALLNQWQWECDADGIRSLDAIVVDAERACVVDGECLIRRRIRQGGVMPLKLQLLEIDWLDSTKIGPTAGGGQIVNGIEYDSIGRVAAYWLYDSHPGDAARAGRIASQPVPAKDIIHYFAPNRPGQGRGVTRLHSIIARVRDLSLYEDAELARKNLESRMGIIASGNADSLAQPLPGASTVTQTQLAAGDLGQIPSGGIVEIPAGLNVTAFEPKSPPGYVETVKFQLHLISAGLGVPYYVATGDVKEVNFSSARIRETDYKRDTESHRWMNSVPRLLRPICAWFADAVELMDGTPADYAWDYTFPRWDYVNPKQDVEAERAVLESGMDSLSETIRRRGLEPSEVFAEMASDYKALESSGAIKLMQLLMKTPAAQPVPPSDSAGTQDQDTSQP